MLFQIFFDRGFNVGVVDIAWTSVLDKRATFPEPRDNLFNLDIQVLWNHSLDDLKSIRCSQMRSVDALDGRLVRTHTTQRTPQQPLESRRKDI